MTNDVELRALVNDLVRILAGLPVDEQTAWLRCIFTRLDMRAVNTEAFEQVLLDIENSLRERRALGRWAAPGGRNSV